MTLYTQASTVCGIDDTDWGRALEGHVRDLRRDDVPAPDGVNSDSASHLPAVTVLRLDHDSRRGGPLVGPHWH